AKKYSFVMEDANGEIVRVVASGKTPVNLFDAESVVVRGIYSGEEFLAQDILVKCPSKYEAEEHPDDVEKQ
ncbi:MAG: cytochrome c maturation protein CcmE, partial [Firmicutes bacterium]|nr:cytochrome c maturation protein CcmE [Bacillota bacterium]